MQAVMGNKELINVGLTVITRIPCGIEYTIRK